MNSKPKAREARSVRLRDDEWVVAEAIARLNGESSAGSGLRTALTMAAASLRRTVGREEFASLLEQIRSERAESGR